MPDAATITIILSDQGLVSVNGPLENKLLMFGLLEIAKETVIDHNHKRQSGIIPATLTFPPMGGRS